MNSEALGGRIFGLQLVAFMLLGFPGGCRQPGDSCCKSNGDCAAGAICFEGMCAARCIADTQCQVGEQCTAAGACAAPMREPSPCAFTWPAVLDFPLDAGLPGRDASLPPDGGELDDGGVPSVCQEDIFEPNNSFFEATPVPFGEAVDLSICSQDRDLFALQAQRGDEIGALLEYRYEEGDLDLALFFDGRTIAVSQDTQDTEEIRHLVEDDGDYFFEVYGFPTDIENDYRFSAYRTSAPCQVDVFEDNDNIDEAAQIVLGEAIDATLCPTDTSDFFSLELNEPGVEIEVRLNYESPAGMRLGILTPEGQSSFSESASGEEVVNFIVPQAGIFGIQVSGSVEEGQTGNYQLIANAIAPPCGDAFEPNDAPQDAAEIGSPTEIEGTICPADFDYFLLDVGAGIPNILLAGQDIFGSVLRPSDFELLATLELNELTEVSPDPETESLLILVGPLSTSDVGLPYNLIFQ